MSWVEDVLAAHWYVVRNPWFGQRIVGCKCGWDQPVNSDRNAERHHAHVAAALRAAMREQVFAHGDFCGNDPTCDCEGCWTQRKVLDLLTGDRP